VHILESVTENELRDLYCGATALFFPSAYEGFGLPILEAMACGTPVVTTRASSLPEVGGDAPVYVSVSDPTELLTTMTLFENRQIDAMTVAMKGIARAAQFSWERCADMTIGLYRACLGI
jgi:glycosyltransferase involved in cell wall biosynthesis